MNLTQARQKAAEDLQARGLTAVDHVPSRAIPPIVVVSADTPWLEPGDTFDGRRFRVNMRALLVGQTATNSVVTKQLDDLVATAIAALAEWDVNNVDQPGVIELNGTGYLGTYIRFSNYIDIEGV